MGRATIASGGEDGLYTAAIDYDATTAAALETIIQEILDLQGEVSLINTDISALRIELRELESEYHASALDYQEIIRELSWQNNEFVFYPPAPPKGQFGYTISSYSSEHLKNVDMMNLRAWLAHNPNPADSRLSDAFIELVRIGTELWKLRGQIVALVKQRGVLMYRIAVLQKRQEEIDTATQPGEAQSMWCADLTEDLTGAVDTIEIKGAPDQILIGPAGVSGLLHNGNAGALANIMAMSPAGAGLAWALLPGWQKWRPTYRVGVIDSIDYEADTASVTLDAATSIAQDLDVNQTLTLTDIPVDYMTCDAAAFENGDRVVVEFPGQLWEQGPKVIGFETNPQPCDNLAVIWWLADAGGWLVADGRTWDTGYRWYSIDPDLAGDDPFLCLPHDPEVDESTHIELLPQIGTHDLDFDFVDGWDVTTNPDDYDRWPHPGPTIGDLVGLDLSAKIGVAQWVHLPSGATFWWVNKDGSMVDGADQWGGGDWATGKCFYKHIVTNNGVHYEYPGYYHRRRVEVSTTKTTISSDGVVLFEQDFKQTNTIYTLWEEGEGTNTYTRSYAVEPDVVNDRIRPDRTSISDPLIVPDLEAGANNQPGAVVKGVEGYTDYADYIFLYESWALTGGHWVGSDGPCNNLTYLPDSTAVQKLNLNVSGTTWVLDACDPVAYSSYLDFEFIYQPRVVNIYDYHGEPFYVFSFVKRRRLPAMGDPVCYFGCVWRGELTLSGPFPGEPAAGAHTELDIYNSKADYGKRNLCVARGVEVKAAVTYK